MPTCIDYKTLPTVYVHSYTCWFHNCSKIASNFIRNFEEMGNQPSSRENRVGVQGQNCVSQECKHVWEKVRCISDFARIFYLDSVFDDHMYLIQAPANCVRSSLQMLISQLLKKRVEIHPKFRRNGVRAVVSGKPCRRTRPELRLAGVSTFLGESTMHFGFCADLWSR